MAAAKKTKKAAVEEVKEVVTAAAPAVEEAKETVAVEAPAAKPAKKASCRKTTAKKEVKEVVAVEAPVVEEVKEAVAVEAPIAEEVKAETKKTPAKKTASKKTESKHEVAPECKVFVEYQGSQFAARSILDQALEAYKAAHTDEIKTVELYVKPEEHVAYYVINGEGSDAFCINL